MSVLKMTPSAPADPQEAERIAYERFAREHADESYRRLLRDLYAEWHRFNRTYFGGRLRVPHLAIGRTSPRRLSSCRRTTDYGGAMAITLNEGVAFGTNRQVVRRPGGPGVIRFLHDLLLAETTCQAVRELADDDEDAYGGYGPRFVEHANRIGQVLDLPPVVARRRGFPDRDRVAAANWPWAVRPADHYLGDVTLPGRRRRYSAPYTPIVYQGGIYEYFLLLLSAEGGADRLRLILGRQVDAAKTARSPALASAERGPAKPAPVDTSWVTWNGGCVARITEYISHYRAFAAMPILADALEDAGCDQPDILAHCRQARDHTARCWVLAGLRQAAARLSRP